MCHLCDGVGRLVAASSALMVEALAMREVCYLLLSRSLLDVSIFSVCKALVLVLSSDLNPPWEVAAIIANVRRLCLLIRARWFHVRRIFNKATHSVAKAAVKDALRLD